MPKVTFTDHDGNVRTVDADNGESVMQAARRNDVPGIDADCGGACACGTCHCYVESGWREVAGDADIMEESMLGMRPDRDDGSRLSCQIDVTPDMDGMVVRLPEFQM